MHIHVLMLCRKFELIPIKVGFFYKFLNLLKKSGQRPCTIIARVHKGGEYLTLHTT